MNRHIQLLLLATCISMMFGNSQLASADCPPYLIASKSRNDTHYKWQGKCFSRLRCRPCGPVHQKKLPRVVRHHGSCSRRYIANRRADGCSAPTLTPFKKKFAHACHEHDICYATPGVTKRQCDRDFLENMYAMCRHGGPGCNTAAEVYYTAVAYTDKGVDSWLMGQEWADSHCQ